MLIGSENTFKGTSLTRYAFPDVQEQASGQRRDGIPAVMVVFHPGGGADDIFFGMEYRPLPQQGHRLLPG